MYTHHPSGGPDTWSLGLVCFVGAGELNLKHSRQALSY